MFPSDFQDGVVIPCDPLEFGYALVTDQIAPQHHQQVNGYTLSRPRDFVSTLPLEPATNHGSISSNASSSSSTSPRANTPTLVRGRESDMASDRSHGSEHASNETPSSATAAAHRDYLSALPEDGSLGLGCALPETSATIQDNFCGSGSLEQGYNRDDAPLSSEPNEEPHTPYTNAEEMEIKEEVEVLNHDGHDTEVK